MLVRVRGFAVTNNEFQGSFKEMANKQWTVFDTFRSEVQRRDPTVQEAFRDGVYLGWESIPPEFKDMQVTHEDYMGSDRAIGLYELVDMVINPAGTKFETHLDTNTGPFKRAGLLQHKARLYTPEFPDDVSKIINFYQNREEQKAFLDGLVGLISIFMTAHERRLRER